MTAQYTLVVKDDITPFFNRLNSKLSPNKRKDLNRHIGARGEELTKGYLLKISKKRHATAQRLGAKPTGFLEKAAESVESTVGNNFASVLISSPGIGRAFGDITIKPKKTYLTIPVHKDAYGKRAGEFDNLVFIRNTVKETAVLGRKVEGSGEMLEAMYVLVTKAFQKQDRTLLPTDEQYGHAMELGARDYINSI